MSFKFFIEISKSFESEGERYISGAASGTLTDGQGERMNVSVLNKFKAALPLPLTDAHLKDGIFKEIGTVLDGEVVRKGEEYELIITAQLDKENYAADQLFRNLQKGKKYGFSIKGINPKVTTVYEEGEGYILEYVDMEPIDITITTQPAYKPSMIQALQKSLISEMDEVTKSETYTDYPDSAVNNARKVLEWKREHGDEVKGMTQVGWTRANQLAKREALSAKTVKRMAAFARHEKNAKIDPQHEGTPWKDAGYVAWLGWGGTSGINWAKRKSKQIDKSNILEDKIPVMNRKEDQSVTVAKSKDANEVRESEAKKASETTSKASEGTTEMTGSDKKQAKKSRMKELEKRIDSIEKSLDEIKKMYDGSKKKKKVSKSMEVMKSLNEKLEPFAEIMQSMHEDIETLKKMPLQKKSVAATVEKSYEDRAKKELDLDAIEDPAERFKAKLLNIR